MAVQQRIGLPSLLSSPRDIRDLGVPSRSSWAWVLILGGCYAINLADVDAIAALGRTTGQRLPAERSVCSHRTVIGPRKEEQAAKGSCYSGTVALCWFSISALIFETRQETESVKKKTSTKTSALLRGLADAILESAFNRR